VRSGEKGKLGLEVEEISPQLREEYGLPQEAGLIVTAVEGGSPADKAGSGGRPPAGGGSPAG